MCNTVRGLVPYMLVACSGCGARAAVDFDDGLLAPAGSAAVDGTGGAASVATGAGGSRVVPTGQREPAPPAVAPGSGGSPGAPIGPADAAQASISSGAEGPCDPAEFLPASMSRDAAVPDAGDSDASVNLGLGEGDLTVLVVFDKSGSMSSGWDSRSKWRAASDALLESIVGVEDLLTIGAILFPLEYECSVPAFGNAPQIAYTSGRRFTEEWLRTACTHQADGATPMGVAFKVADAAVRDAKAAGRIEGRRFRVVVVTDGEPNCDTNQGDLTYYPSAWTEMGVQTTVLGLPGSETAAALLDSIASAGGTEKHLAPGSPTALGDAMYILVR